MSCPKCGSGAVFQGKCRECGTVVDVRRASSVGVSRAPSLGEDDDVGEDTVADPRARRPDPDATMAPPMMARRSPGRDDAEAGRGDEDPERTRMPPAARKPSRLAQPVTEPPAPAPARARPPTKQAEAAPEFVPDKPIEVKDRSNWYKEAGLRPPPAGSAGANANAEDDFAPTANNPVGGYTAPAAVLFALAAGALFGVAFGLNPIALLAGGVALIAALLLWRGGGAGKIAGWVAAAVFVAWGAALAVGFKQPLLAGLTLFPTACLAVTMLLEVRGVRSAVAGIGVAVALLGLGATALSGRKFSEGAATAEAVDGVFEDGASGLSVRVPSNVLLWSRPKDIEARLPAPWPSVGLRLGFATSDAGFVGGVLQTTQRPGAELKNMLAPVSGGSTAPPRRNDRLVPDALRELEAEGWEVSTGAGELLVVLAKAPDGRAVALFGVLGAAKGRNGQLFNAVADGVRLKKGLEAE